MLVLDSMAYADAVVCITSSWAGIIGETSANHKCEQQQTVNYDV